MRIVAPKSALYQIFERAYPGLDCWPNMEAFRQGKTDKCSFLSLKRAIDAEDFMSLSETQRARRKVLESSAMRVIPDATNVVMTAVSEQLTRIFSTGLAGDAPHWFSSVISVDMALILLKKTEENLGLREEILDFALGGAGFNMTIAEKESFLKSIVQDWDSSLKILYAGLYAHDNYARSLADWVNDALDKSLQAGFDGKYRNALWNQHKYWQMRDNEFVSLRSTSGDEDDGILFGNMYVLPGFKTLSGLEMDLEHVARSSARMITAQTSLGKSSFLQAIALASVHLETVRTPPDVERSACNNISEFAKKLGLYGKSCLPVYFACRRFSNANDDILKIAIEEALTAGTGFRVQASPEEYMPMLQKASQGNRLILLIDGYDEVPDALRPDFREALWNVLLKLPRAKVIMTCRPLPGEADGNLIIGNVAFAPVILQPFDEKRQMDLLERIRKFAYTDQNMIEAVRALKDNNRYVKQLAANPYMLISITHHFSGSVSQILSEIIKQLMRRHLDLYSKSLESVDVAFEVGIDMAERMFMKLAIDSISAEGGIMNEAVLERSFKNYWRDIDSAADSSKVDSIWRLTRMMFGCRAGIIVAASSGYRFLADVIHWHLAADAIMDEMDLQMLEKVDSNPVFGILSMMMLVKFSNSNDQYEFELSIVESFMKRLNSSSGEDKARMVEILSDLIWDVYGNSHVTSQLLKGGTYKYVHEILQKTVLEAYIANVDEVPESLAGTRIYKNHEDLAEELAKKKKSAKS
ncbi:MAG: hypothetical protein LBT59_11385 [Clostridiales bacterium]|nr:hypothetical protein [Clostridiales bacterium]